MIIWDVFWPFGLFGIVGVILLVPVVQFWKADIAELEQRSFPSGTFLRGSVAASPVLLAWCLFSAIVGIIIAIDGRQSLPALLIVAVGVLWFGWTLLCLSAAYYGRPRRALLPALRSDASYARFTRAR